LVIICNSNTNVHGLLATEITTPLDYTIHINMLSIKEKLLYALRIFLLLVVVGISITLLIQGHTFILSSILSWIQNLGFGGVLFLSVLYTLSALFFLPAGPLALAAGYMFGFWWGFLAAVLGYHVGGTVAFFCCTIFIARLGYKTNFKMAQSESN